MWVSWDKVIGSHINKSTIINPPNFPLKIVLISLTTKMSNKKLIILKQRLGFYIYWNKYYNKT